MEIQLGNRIADVTLLSKEGNKVSVEVDGKVYNVDICMFANGRCSILNDGISYDPFIIHEPGSKHYSVSLNYSTYDIDILDSQAKYMKMRKKGAVEKQNEKIVSPMPSKVIKILAEEGQRLKAGEVAIVIEAMKMQSSILVTEDCTVQSVCCKVGDSVMAEQVLMTLKVDESDAE